MPRVPTQSGFKKVPQALGIKPSLLRRLAGMEDLTRKELTQLEECLSLTDETPAECRQIGLLPLEVPSRR